MHENLLHEHNKDKLRQSSVYGKGFPELLVTSDLPDPRNRKRFSVAGNKKDQPDLRIGKEHFYRARRLATLRSAFARA
jgi:hypothetical protein